MWSAQDAARAKGVLEITGARVLPLLNVAYPAENCSHGTVSVIGHLVIRKGGVPNEAPKAWTKDLVARGVRGEYSFRLTATCFWRENQGPGMDRFIDSHNHLQGFSFDDWELQGMCGMVGSVISCGNPHVHREIWKRPPGPKDVQRLWDSPLRMAEAAEAKHRIRAMCAVGVSSMTRVEGWEPLIDALRVYLENKRVAALGEVGLDPGQYFGFSWDLEDQARCLEAQARIAAELKKPLILHTPTYKNPKEFLGGVDTQGEVSPEAFRLHYLKMDLEVIDAAGLDHSLLVIDHVDATIVDFVHEETGAWCATSLGSRLRPIPAAAVVEWVRRHGAGRILLNSDLIPYTSNDLYCIPRAIRAMRRGGIAEAEIEKAAFGNANALFGFGL